MNLSVCIIMKNEEANIGRCLEALLQHGFPKENIVLVDTGSTDRSVELAEKYLDTVYHFAWIDDFAAAKNHAASLATTDTVLILDADEYVEEADWAELERLIKAHPHEAGTILRDNHIEKDGIHGMHRDRTERIYDRREYAFFYPIHEQLLPKNGGEGHYYEATLRVSHSGYLLSPEATKKKAERNIFILMKELEQRKEDPYILFQLGQSYYFMEDMEHAVEWYEKGLKQKTDPKAEYVQMMVIGYGEALLALEKNKEALEYFSGIYECFSFTPEFVFLMGQIYLNNGMLLQAYAEYLKCLQMKPNRTEGVTSFYAYHSIALINEMLGEKEAAIGFYKKAGDYPRSLARLKELESEGMGQENNT